MSARTVDWSAARAPRPEHAGAEGLRERKKRLMRRQLSDTATEMFMERGFDAVRVAEIAAACGVSEKTVFNYFPTKESLILDRWQDTATALRAGLAEPGHGPVRATLRILDDELAALISWLAAQPDPVRASASVLRFGSLVRSTPSLRAHQRDATESLIAVAAEALAERAGLSPLDPEPQIAANALLGLWDVQFRSLRAHLAGDRTPAEVKDAVSADVERAARLLEAGLGSFADPGEGGTRESVHLPGS
jgi:AcrR family transcriptional regulator